MKRSMTRMTALSLGLAMVFVAASPASAGVTDGYKTPTVVVPYAASKPKIDGRIDDAEWQGAASTNALQTTTHAISPRQTRFWMMWDEDNLYMAMRSPLRKGERVIQAIRDRDHDINVVFDDSYEIWLDAGTHSPDGQPVLFQFLCNYAGARYDVLHEPAVGNSRLGWTAGWNPINRINDRNEWEMEVVIPRKSIYLDKPFADGMDLTCLVARNFKNPWEQNSFEGTGSFSVVDTHSHLKLSKTAPAVQLLAVADPAAGTIGMKLGAFAEKATKIHWSFASDGGAEKSGTLDVPASKEAVASPGLDLDKPGNGSFRIRVLAADNKTVLLDYAALRKFGDLGTLTIPESQYNKGDRVALSLSFNPLANYIRATGDFIDFDARGKIDHCEFTVEDSAGKKLADESFRLDDLSYVRGVIRTGDLPFGEYVTKMKALAADGSVILERESKFSKKDHTEFPWWNTKAGNAEKVLSPWTAVTYKGGKFGVWGRTMQIGTAGLPAKITSQGRDLLAGPAILRGITADGKAEDASPIRTPPKTTVQKDFRVCVTSRASLGSLSVSAETTVEYDGMYKVELTLTPGQKAELRSLQVVLPLTDEAADYVHACGEGIRYGFYYGFLPHEKTGRIWDCRTVDSQPMVVGSFIPYVWVGSTEGGLCWFADSDEGWVPDNDTPAIELVRKPGQKNVELVLNLISSATTIDKPRKIVFAFQASPVKPMRSGWRMDSWWCGDTFANYVYPDNKGSLIWQSLPFTTDTEACKKMVDAKHASANSFIFGVSKYKSPAVPYFEYNTMGTQHTPEQAYFGEAWKNSSGPLYYGKTLTDFVMYNMDKWCRETGIDGWYLDNVRPVQCDNIEAGRGYRLPDGRVQPTYTMFAMRDFFLRLRAVFLENGKQPRIVNHMTNNMIIPWNGAVDIAYDGEHHVIYPEMGKDFMDFWPLERIRVDFPGQWGTAVNFMHEYQGAWTKEGLLKAMRAYTAEIGLHDALPSGNANGMNQAFWIGRDRFGIEADDVKFLGYWQKDTGLSSPTKDVLLAGWLRPKRILVLVANFGEKTDAVVQLDLAKLGLPAADKCQVWDAESEPAQGLTMDAAGKITVPVERHDYRQIVVEVK